MLAVLSTLQSLGQLSEELVVIGGDSASAVLVRVEQSDLDQRVAAIQQLLKCHDTRSRSQLSEFLRGCSEAERTCDEVAAVLSDTMLSADVDEVMLARLDQSLLQLSEQPVNQLFHFQPLTSANSDRLQRLHTHLHSLQYSIMDRSWAVRRQLLTHRDTERKCDEWLQLVTQVQHELTSPHADSLDALLSRRKTFEASLTTQSLNSYVYVY